MAVEESRVFISILLIYGKRKKRFIYLSNFIQKLILKILYNIVYLQMKVACTITSLAGFATMIRLSYPIYQNGKSPFLPLKPSLTYIILNVSAGSWLIVLTSDAIHHDIANTRISIISCDRLSDYHVIIIYITCNTFCTKYFTLKNQMLHAFVQFNLR